MPISYVADISQCSKFEREGEVLMIPWLCFQVTLVQMLAEAEKQQWQATHKIHLRFMGTRFDPSQARDNSLVS